MSVDLIYLAWNRIEFTRQTWRLMIENTDWRLVSQLVVYDDGSTDGTRKFLDKRLGDVPVPARLVHLGLGSPVAAMNQYLTDSEADWFVKLDNDIAVPPGYLKDLIWTQAKHPHIELLGMEGGRIGQVGRPRWGYQVEPCTHIGGVGLMSVEAFRRRGLPRAHGRFGFTEWQHATDVRAAWIKPDLLCVQLDLIPEEPWSGFTRRYQRLGWQRSWPPYSPSSRYMWKWMDA